MIFKTASFYWQKLVYAWVWCQLSGFLLLFPCIYLCIAVKVVNGHAELLILRNEVVHFAKIEILFSWLSTTLDVSLSQLSNAMVWEIWQSSLHILNSDQSSCRYFFLCRHRQPSVFFFKSEPIMDSRKYSLISHWKWEKAKFEVLTLKAVKFCWFYYIINEFKIGRSFTTVNITWNFATS